MNRKIIDTTLIVMMFAGLGGLVLADYIFIRNGNAFYNFAFASIMVMFGGVLGGCIVFIADTIEWFKARRKKQ